MPRHGLAAPGAERSSAMPPAAGRGLASWPIRRKLVALVTVPVLVILGTGSILAYTSVVVLRQAERTRALATVALATNVATVALDNELNQTIRMLQSANPTGTAGAKAAPSRGTVQALSERRTDTDKALASLQDYLSKPPSGGWSAAVTAKASVVPTALAQLPGIRKSVDTSPSVSQVAVDQNFQKDVSTPLRDLTAVLAGDIASSSGNGVTVDQASTLTALAATSFAAADERVLGTIALSENRLFSNGLNTLKTEAVTQDAQLNIALAHATPAQRADIVSIQTDDFRINKFRGDLDELAAGNKPSATAASFSAATGQRLDNIDSLVGQVAQHTRDVASAAVRSALFQTIAIVGLGVFTLLLVFAALAAIARTVTGPMRRLRSGAVEVATIRLPAAVRQIEQQGVDANIDLPPVMPPGLVAGPETLEVAHAVDGLTAEAVRLATSQVRLRHALDEAFVSMSRRSQSMVEKQLAIIDELESTEEDPEQLRNLFRLDHLAARMRRYNDNLLVLAGSSVRTRSNTPVPVSDVFRAATSEMEQYERVRLQPVSSAAVGGPVAGGLIHLLAELLDNAAMYSPPTSPILLTAAFTPDGGMHLEVTDSGVGIPPAELAELNARLATPGTIDTQIPSRMGLFVVGRLAHRSGFEVRLSPRPTGAGTVAEVLVPATHVVGAPGGGEAPRLPTQAAPLPQRASAPALPAAPYPPAPKQPPAPAPALPRRQTPPWPPAEDLPTRDPNPAVAGGSPGLGGLPSRVPGAALSAGPLSTGPKADSFQQPPAALEPFDAFGSPDGTQPPGDPTLTPPSATALWSQRPRTGQPDGDNPRGNVGGAGGSFLGTGPAAGATGDQGDPFGLKPLNGRSIDHGSAGDAPAASTGWPGSPETDPRPAGRSGPSAGGRPDPSGSSWQGSAPPWSTEPAAPGNSDLPRREPRRTEQNGNPGGKLGGPPAAGTPGLFGPALRPSITDTSGFMLPVERVAPITGGLPLRELRKAGGPNPTLPPPADHPLEDSGRPPAPGESSTVGFGSTPVSFGPGAFGGAPQPPAGQAPAAPAQDRFGQDRFGQDAFGQDRFGQDRFGQSPMELAAHDAASTRYHPADPNAPMIGSLDETPPESATTPIFDSISLWFSDEPTTPVAQPPASPAAAGSRPESRPAVAAAEEAERLIDLRDERTPEPAGSAATASLASRWASLGDQQWLATNARAAAGPEVAGDTTAGLPRRQPGANLLPSATSAAPAVPAAASAGPVHRADADTVRGRLGSYQRGVSSARRSRQIPTGGTAAGLFTAARTAADESGHESEDHGGEQ